MLAKFDLVWAFLGVAVQGKALALGLRYLPIFDYYLRELRINTDKD